MVVRIFVTLIILLASISSFAQKPKNAVVLKSLSGAVGIANYNKDFKYEKAFNPFVEESIQTIGKGLSEVSAKRVFIRSITPGKDTSAWQIGVSKDFNKIQASQKLIIYYIGEKDTEATNFKNCMTDLFKSIYTNKQYSIEITPPEQFATMTLQDAETVFFYINRTKIGSNIKTETPMISERLLQKSYKRVLILLDKKKEGDKTKGNDVFTDLLIDNSESTIKQIPALLQGNYFGYVYYQRNNNHCDSSLYKMLLTKKFNPLAPLLANKREDFKEQMSRAGFFDNPKNTIEFMSLPEK